MFQSLKQNEEVSTKLVDLKEQCSFMFVSYLTYRGDQD